MAKLRKKGTIIHKFPKSISGRNKKPRILPFMAVILIATCIYTFFITQKARTPQKLEIERQKAVLNEYSDFESLARPTPNPHIPPADFKVKVPILMYHYVEYVQDRNDTIRQSMNINPGLFETQLRILQDNNYKTYFVKDIPSILDQDLELPERRIILTFDDGYEDFYTFAFPLLKKYKIKSTLYVVNNFLGSKGYLTEDQLKEIVNSRLVEIGAHTLDHVYLKGESGAVAARQIVESKNELEDMLGINIRTFAYPFGAFDDAAIQIVKEASFSAAVSVIPGNVHSKNELFYLYRIRAGAFQGTDSLDTLEKDYPQDKADTRVLGIFHRFIERIKQAK